MQACIERIADQAFAVCRDLKPENFLLADKSENAPLKATDFGLSVFYRPGQVFTDIVGSAYYVAPEVKPLDVAVLMVSFPICVRVQARTQTSLSAMCPAVWSPFVKFLSFHGRSLLLTLAWIIHNSPHTIPYAVVYQAHPGCVEQQLIRHPWQSWLCTKFLNLCLCPSPSCHAMKVPYLADGSSDSCLVLTAVCYLSRPDDMHNSSQSLG